MRVHVLQIGYDDTESVTDRITRVAALVAAQRGADLIVLPELWAAGGFAYREWAERSEALPPAAEGPVVSAMAKAARAAGAIVHAGSIIERAGAGLDRGETGRGLWNTSVVLDPTGNVLATYRKIHRFGFGQGEPTLLEAGTELVTVDLAVGERRVTTGLATCYDVRFPELFRALIDAGANLVVIPAAWPAARIEAWRLLGRARAIENQCLVVQCNTVGTHAGVEMGGHSQVIDATGAVLAEADGHTEEILAVDLDLDAVAEWRSAFPVLADRRLGPP